MTMNPVMHLTDTVSVMGQVFPEEIAALKAEGFTTVMCNRPDHEDPGQPTMDELAAACEEHGLRFCLLYTSPSPRDGLLSRMPSSA